MICDQCENCMEYPIKIVDNPNRHFLEAEKYHFETGWKCTWNGVESLDKNKLSEKNCRCIVE